MTYNQKRARDIHRTARKSRETNRTFRPWARSQEEYRGRFHKLSPKLERIVKG